MEERSRKRSVVSKPWKITDRKVSRDTPKNNNNNNEKSSTTSDTISSSNKQRKVSETAAVKPNRKPSATVQSKRSKSLHEISLTKPLKATEKVESPIKDDTETVKTDKELDTANNNGDDGQIYTASAVIIQPDENIDDFIGYDEDRDRDRYVATPVFAHDFEDEAGEVDGGLYDDGHDDNMVGGVGSCRPKIDCLNLTLDNFDIQR